MTKVIVIDDDPEFVTMVSGKLAKEGIDSKGFESSKDGLTFLKSHKEEVNLIVLDLLMPEMSGWIFMKEMTKFQIIDIPVIVLTNLSHTDIPENLDLNAQMVVKTDVSLKELVELIKVKIKESKS